MTLPLLALLYVRASIEHCLDLSMRCSLVCGIEVVLLSDD